MFSWPVLQPPAHDPCKYFGSHPRSHRRSGQCVGLSNRFLPFCSFLCVVSISVPCASFTGASVSAIWLTRVPSLSSDLLLSLHILSTLQSMLLMLQVTAWAQSCSCCEYSDSSVDSTCCHLWYFVFQLFAPFLTFSSCSCSSFVTSMATMTLPFRPCPDCSARSLVQPALGMHL